MSFGNRAEGLAWERKFLSSALASTLGMTSLEQGHHHLDRLVEMVNSNGGLDIVKSQNHESRDADNVTIDTDWLFQSGNLKAVDFSRKVAGGFVFGNIKFSTSEKKIEDNLSSFLSVMKGKKVEICRGTAIPLFRFLSKSSYGLMMAFPCNDSKGSFVLCEVDLAKYRELAINANAFMGNSNMGVINAHTNEVALDRKLQAYGLNRSSYGDYRRLMNETYGLDSGVLTLEIKPFGRSFQSLHPCKDWSLPPVLIKAVGNTFEFIEVL
jgi:hypothetical protein